MPNFREDKKYYRYRVIQKFDGENWIDYGDKEYPSSDLKGVEKDFIEVAKDNQEIYRVVNRKRKLI